MKNWRSFALGTMTALYGLGLLQDIPRRDAWVIVFAGAAIVIASGVVEIVSTLRERRREQMRKVTARDDRKPLQVREVTTTMRDT